MAHAHCKGYSVGSVDETVSSLTSVSSIGGLQILEMEEPGGRDCGRCKEGADEDSFMEGMVF